MMEEGQFQGLLLKRNNRIPNKSLGQSSSPDVGVPEQA